ncbi:kinase-like domain-containing protein, partial [Schizophyllum commune]
MAPTAEKRKASGSPEGARPSKRPDSPEEGEVDDPNPPPKPVSLSLPAKPAPAKKATTAFPFKKREAGPPLNVFERAEASIKGSSSRNRGDSYRPSPPRSRSRSRSSSPRQQHRLPQQRSTRSPSASSYSPAPSHDSRGRDYDREYRRSHHHRRPHGDRDRRLYLPTGDDRAPRPIDEPRSYRPPQVSDWRSRADDYDRYDRRGGYDDRDYYARDRRDRSPPSRRGDSYRPGAWSPPPPRRHSPLPRRPPSPPAYRPISPASYRPQSPGVYKPQSPGTYRPQSPPRDPAPRAPRLVSPPSSKPPPPPPADGAPPPPVSPPPAPPPDPRLESAIPPLPATHASISIAMKRPPAPAGHHSPKPMSLPPTDASAALKAKEAKKSESPEKEQNLRAVVARKVHRPLRSREEEKAAYGRVFIGCGLQSDYEVTTKLGEGTFGEVHKALHSSTNRLVALKRILMHNEKEGMPVTALREIKILKALKHPHIVPLVDMFVVRSNPKDPLSVYMVFPYMDHDLAGLLENERAHLQPSHIKQYMKQLLEGTEYMHKNNIVHRDMKAANLLINNEGCLQIADFGLARAFDPRVSQGLVDKRYTNCVVTRWYRPPELLLGARQYGGEIDLWGIGCVLGEMFVRHPILPGSSDLDQVDRIWQLCGTPNQQTWPNFDELPGCEGVRRFQQYPKQLHKQFHAFGKDTCSLLDALLTCNPRERITATEALDHEWFWNAPFPADPKNLPQYEASHELDKRGHHRAGPPPEQRNPNPNAVPPHGPPFHFNRGGGPPRAGFNRGGAGPPPFNPNAPPAFNG